MSAIPAPRPAELIAKLERHYLSAVVGIGGASGAAAAVPGVGTAAALASGAAEIAAFVSATAMFVLAVAEVHGLPVSDPEVRRALVLAVLLGESAEAALTYGAFEAPHWAQVLGRTASRDRVAGVNARLAKLALGRFGRRQGVLALGRALPLGIGAGIGAVGNAALARGAIGVGAQGVRAATAGRPRRGSSTRRSSRAQMRTENGTERRGLPS